MKKGDKLTIEINLMFGKTKTEEVTIVAIHGNKILLSNGMEMFAID